MPNTRASTAPVQTRHRKAGKEQTQAAGQHAQKDAKRKADTPLATRQAKKAVLRTPQVPAQRLRSVRHNDNEYRVGDDAYVVLDPEAFNNAGGLDENEEMEACEICRRVTSGKAAMLECDACLRGFHTTCLRPKLHKVPEGDWHCPNCVSGEPPPSSASTAVTLRQKLLSRAAGLGVVRIVELLSTAPRSKRDKAHITFKGRWYCLPEETHVGRQRQHVARELFLTQQIDENDIDTLLRPCLVCSPAEFEAASAAGDDVFLCDYKYDTVLSSFKRLDSGEDGEAELDQLAVSDEEPASTAEDTEGESEDEDIASPKQRWRRCERASRLGPTPRAPKGSRAGNRHSLGLQALRLGAAEIPEAVRRKDADPLTALRGQLSEEPRRLPCRESERKAIATFVEEALSAAGKDSLGRSLYVSGVPGTGKTATVMEIMRDMRRQAAAGQLPPFQFVEVNGMRLNSAKEAYTALYEAMTGMRAGPDTAAAALEEMFCSGRRVKGNKQRGVTLLLVDEMDQLLSAKGGSVHPASQRVLYNLMEWPLQKGSHLAVIGIANTLDLPERLLPRIASRLAGRRVAFQPYNRAQLKQILETRLAGSDLLEKDAISYVAGKVSSTSGDVRRCLQLCNRAIALAAEEAAAAAARAGLPASPLAQPGMVTVEHVDEAVQEAYQSEDVMLMRRLPRPAKILLAALLMEIRATGMHEVQLGPAAERAMAMAASHGERVPSYQAYVRLAADLEQQKFIFADGPERRLLMRITLNCQEDDIRTAIKCPSGVGWLQDLNF